MGLSDCLRLAGGSAFSRRCGFSCGEPEPDLAIVMGPAGRYDASHPTPADIAAVVEVADTTLQYDRTLKLRAYAQAGIAVYWLLNLEDRQVEVFTNPTAGAKLGYGSRVHSGPAPNRW
jgi:Uma2 family endonuclease